MRSQLCQCDNNHQDRALISLQWRVTLCVQCGLWGWVTVSAALGAHSLAGNWSHSRCCCDDVVTTIAVFSLALCEILSHWQQGRTVHSGLSLLGHNQLSWLSYSEWGRVGTLAPAPVAPARSWLSELFTEHWTWRQAPDTRRDTGTEGSRGHTDVLTLHSVSVDADWWHVRLTTLWAPDTQSSPWSPHITHHPARDKSTVRAEKTARSSGASGAARAERTGSAGPRLCWAALSGASCRGVAREAQSCEIWGRVYHVYHVLSPPGDPGYYVSRTHTSVTGRKSVLSQAQPLPGS